MQKYKDNKSHARDGSPPPIDDAGASAKPKLKRKEYEEELRKLHVSSEQYRPPPSNSPSSPPGVATSATT